MSISFEAIGTHWLIDVHLPMDIAQAVRARIDTFDQAYSRFRDDSWVSRLAALGNYDTPPDAPPLFDMYRQLYEATDGHVTPLIGSLMDDIGYDAKYSFRTRPSLRQAPDWDDALVISRATVRVKQPVSIDVGAAGKGYLVDIIGHMLEDAGIRDYVINAGGDIRRRAAGECTVAIGLEDPRDTSRIVGTVQLGNRSICASAGSKRAWGEYHHIVDPVTRQSPRDVVATWVIADDAMVADGIATALFFVRPEALISIGQFEYMIMNATHGIEQSAGFSAEVYT